MSQIVYFALLERLTIPLYKSQRSSPKINGFCQKEAVGVRNLEGDFEIASAHQARCFALCRRYIIFAGTLLCLLYELLVSTRSNRLGRLIYSTY
jgi:hypothetical protein